MKIKIPDDYKIEKKVSEDAKSETFEARDLRLNRVVHLVILKSNASENMSREFLLHARSIGQLKHPSILPIYDMGVMDDHYFYTTRPAPADPLDRLLRQRKKNNKNLFLRSREYRLQLLSDIAEAVSYAHSKGVSVSRLGFDAIVMGQFGEVIIQDWSKSRWIKRDGSDSEIPLNWMADDLRELALLGLNLYFLKLNRNDITPVMWGKITHKLPYDLQVIFDRAFYGRPTPYSSVKDFQKDFNRHLGGLPIEMQRGDYLAMMSGFYRRHRARSLYFMMACLLSLGIALFYLPEMMDKNSNAFSLGDRTKETQAQLDFFQIKIDEKSKVVDEITDKYNSKAEQVAELKEDSEKKEAAHQKLEKDLEKYNSLIEGVEQAEKDLDQEVESLKIELEENKLDLKSDPDGQEQLKSLNSSDSRAIQDTYLLDEILRVKRRGGVFEPEILQSVLAEKPFINPWIVDYLREGSSLGQHHLKELAKINPETVPFTDAKGSCVAWLESNKLSLFNFNLKSPSVMFLPARKYTSLVFSSDNHVLHGLSSTGCFTIELDAAYSSPKFTLISGYQKNLGTPLAYSKPGVLSFLGRDSKVHVLRKGMKPKTLNLKLPKDEVIRKMQLSGADFVLAESSDSLFILSRAPRLRLLKKIPLNGRQVWNFIPSSKMFYITGVKHTALYRVSDQVNLIRSLPYGVEPVGFIRAEKRSFWTKKMNQTCLLDLVATQLESYPSIQGTPLLSEGGQVLMWQKKSLRLYSREGLSPSELPSIQKALAQPPGFQKTEAFLGLRKPIVDMCKPKESRSSVILLNGPYHIEIWDVSKKVKILNLGVSAKKLKRIFYSEEMKAPVSLDEEGQYKVW